MLQWERSLPNYSTSTDDFLMEVNEGIKRTLASIVVQTHNFIARFIPSLAAMRELSVLVDSLGFA